MVLMLHTFLKATVSPVRGSGSIGTGPCTYPANPWSSVRTSQREFQRNQFPYHRVRTDLAFWKDICVVRGLYTLVQSALREHVLAKVYYGPLAIVNIKQHCRGLVWWQHISRYLEAMVRLSFPHFCHYSLCQDSQRHGPRPRWTSVENYMASHITSVFY